MVGDWPALGLDAGFFVSAQRLQRFSLSYAKRWFRSVLNNPNELILSRCLLAVGPARDDY